MENNDKIGYSICAPNETGGKFKVLNANILKLIAIFAMTVDHIAWAVFCGYSTHALPIIMHIVGRITCPIMCFFVAEGYHYTRNIRKYTARMFVFAAISHFAYIFASTDFAGWTSFIPFCNGGFLNQTSVMWALAWGLVMLRVAHSEKIKSAFKPIVILLICVVALSADWSCVASLCILAIGTNRGNFKKQMLWMLFYVVIYSAVYFFALDRLYGCIQLGVVLAVPLLALYNGRRGKNPKLNKFLKWGFYIYYPLHLAVIGVILHVCNGL